MLATRLKMWTGTILALGVLLGSVPWTTHSLEAQPKKRGPFSPVGWRL